MTKFAVGDKCVHNPDGNRVTIVSINAPNATVSYDNGSAANFTTPLTSLTYAGPIGYTTGVINGVNAGGVRTIDSNTGLAIMSPDDFYVTLTDSNTTGITFRSLAINGQQLFVKNATGATFSTGDANIVNGHTWQFIFDGTNWNQVVVA